MWRQAVATPMEVLALELGGKMVRPGATDLDCPEVPGFFPNSSFFILPSSIPVSRFMGGTPSRRAVGGRFA